MTFPVVARLNQVAPDVFMDGSGFIHGDADCPDPCSPVTQKSMSLLDLDEADVCPECAYPLFSRARRMATLIEALSYLGQGPEIAADGETPLRGQACAVVTRFREALGDTDPAVLSGECGPEAEELRNLVAELRRPWDRWFAEVSAAELTLIARACGTTVTITPTGFDVRCGEEPLIVSAAPGVLTSVVLDEFMAALVAGVDDVATVATERVLARDRLFTTNVIDGDRNRVAQLAAEGLALTEIVERVRDEVARAEVEHLMARFAVNVGPEEPDGGWVVVAGTQPAWSTMFWSTALRFSFDSVNVGEATAVALPRVVADKVLHSVQSDALRRRVAASPALAQETATLVLHTTGALLDDRMDVRTALETAVAVAS